MQSNPVKKVVIAGGGTAGWMAAAAISRQLGEVLDICLVESDEIGTVGVGEATIPPMRVFHSLLRIDEQEFMRETESTFKLGILFENWSQVGENYFHSFGKTGKETWLAEFVHFWLRAKELGIAKEFGEYCMELQAAKSEKFARSSQFDINYAYHLDATRYAKFLRKLAEKEGVKRVEGKIATVNQDTKTGFIQSLTLDSGDVIAGDLFIDCTGFRGLLIEQTLHTGYEDWSHWLPCDSAVAMQTESVGPAVPYTFSIAHESGWRWRIPLQHRVGNGLVYCSRYMSDQEAIEKLKNDVEGRPITEPRVIKFRTGRRRKNWNKNCVALGLASGFLEPLESTSMHLIMMGVTRLMRLFPFSGIQQSIVDEYNEQANIELEKIRDFIILHYKVTNRDDSPFWQYCRNMDVPETLAKRIDIFRNEAHAFQKDGELFRVDSWTQVMLGQGIMPKSYHSFAKIMQEKDLQTFLTSLQTNIAQVLDSLPPHQDFLNKYCKASSM